MRHLFVHQNFPGQYRHLASRLGRDPAHQVYGLGDYANLKDRPTIAGVRRVAYESPDGAGAATHAWARPFEAAVRRGESVARACAALRRDGFEPDVVYAHPGWGEALFLRDLFPRARLIGYFEFYYRAAGADVGFDPEFTADTTDTALRLRARNAHLLLSMQDCDAGVAPTRWQARQLPPTLAARARVIHDGIDTDTVRPDDAAYVELARAGVRLTAADEVITFVARNLEPYRGFHVFMRALPALLRRRPRAHVLIVGGDDVSYSPRPRAHPTYRQMLLAELNGTLDAGRVHFVGKLPYAHYLRVLQVSSAHVYLTYPFVLSWSCLEAMSAGCLVIGSRTPPVEEVIEHDRNGLLVDFFQQEPLLDAIDRALDDRDAMRPLRAAARRSVIERFDLRTVCLPRQLALAEGRDVTA